MPASRQMKLIAGIFILVAALLAAGYYMFLRTDYAVLYNGLRQSDASAIVSELDAKGISYKLRDKGTTILVPEDEADTVRLGIAGSDIPSKGAIGFELFNKSDMGLTDFAQKINYQRALQGELARTIMMMDGIVDARVHLSIPERSVFRGNRSEPKAAVTIAAQRGRALDGTRVAGIQRLVAAAVPDLAIASVVVLDEVGRIISSSALADDSAGVPADQVAVQQFYRARIRAAVEGVMPGLPFDVRVLVSGPAPAAGRADWSGGGTPALTIPAPGSRRDFGLRVAVVTPTPLGSEDENVVRSAASGAAGLKLGAGDSLDFHVGPPAAAAPAPQAAPAAPLPQIQVAPSPLPVGPAKSPLLLWLLGLAAAAGGLLLYFATRRRPALLSDEERQVFVERIRKQLSPREEVEDVRA